MKYTETYPSMDGLFTLEYHVYEPLLFNGTMIQIAHGMAEHKDRYDGFCLYLCSLGYLVVIHDHRGHGKSTNERYRHGDMGMNGFEEAVKDMHYLTGIVKERFRPNRFVLLGHSMGSLLSRGYLLNYEKELDGLILTGTPSMQFGIGAAMSLARIIIMLKGNAYQSKLLEKLVLGSFNRPFSYRTGFEWLNRDNKEVDAYVEDEYCGFTFSARSFYDLFGGMKKVFGKYQVPKKSMLPILFVSGNEDPCGKMGRGVERCVNHLRRQGYHNVSMKLLPEMRHEILLELERQTVYDEVVSFLSNMIENK